MADSSTEGNAPVVDTTVVPVVNDAGSAPAPVVTAEPTPAKEQSPLDVVSEALRKTGVDAASPAAENRSPTGEPDPKPKPSEGQEGELSDEEKKTFSAGAQQRIRDLAAQKNTLIAERDTFKPKAESFDKLTGFLSRNGISSDEANNSLNVTALIKAGKYAPALELLKPIYSELQKRAGEVLDPDLQEEVRLGTTPHERALELQRLRAANASTTTQQKIEEDRRSDEAKSNAWTAHVTDVAKAADDWAKTQAGSDPDWDKKADEVAEAVKLDLLQNGFPKTPAEAIERSKKALETVNKRWSSRRPAPVAITPNVGNGRSSTSKDAPPKTAMEAIERALAG